MQEQVLSAEEFKSVLIKSVHKNINAPGLVQELYEKALVKALEDLVADTENKLDDILVAAILPQLKILLQDNAQKLWDSLLLGDGKKEPQEGGI